MRLLAVAMNLLMDLGVIGISWLICCISTSSHSDVKHENLSSLKFVKGFIQEQCTSWFVCHFILAHRRFIINHRWIRYVYIFNQIFSERKYFNYIARENGPQYNIVCITMDNRIIVIFCNNLAGEDRHLFQMAHRNCAFINNQTWQRNVQFTVATDYELLKKGGTHSLCFLQ